MPRKVDWDEELRRARVRNAARLRRDNEKLNPSRYLELRHSEASTLAVVGGVTIRRSIPPCDSSHRLWQCRYGRKGMVVWLHEPVKWWGADKDNARYLYVENVDWKTAIPALGWTECNAQEFPEKARRFRMLILDVRRIGDQWIWELDLQRLEN